MSGSGRGVIRGIGDDCAVFRPKAGEDLLLKTDQLIEGVHFPKSMRPETIGERALARALSDIAAAGGDPRCCLVALAVPRNKSERWILSFFRGLLRLAKRTGTVLAGGDLAHDDKVHCSVMVVGAVQRGKALTRAGARPGDQLYVSGRLGKPWDQRIEPRLALGRKLVGQSDRLHRPERWVSARSAPAVQRISRVARTWKAFRSSGERASNARSTAAKTTSCCSPFRRARSRRPALRASARYCAAVQVPSGSKGKSSRPAATTISPK